MVKKPEPQILTLDPNDENIILGVPDDPDPNSLTNTEPVKEKKVKLCFPCLHSRHTLALVVFFLNTACFGGLLAAKREEHYMVGF